MLRIELSLKASNKLDYLLHYLEKEWSKKAKDSFIKKLDKKLLQISSFPESSSNSELKPGLYKALVTKQTSLIYRFDNEKITIITVFDNRMHPKRLKKDIN